MTEQDQQKALAELDGLEPYGFPHGTTEGEVYNRQGWTRREQGNNKLIEVKEPAYLTSYDAIIPLIQKQTRTIQCFVMNNLEETFCVKDKHENEYMRDVLNATPSQLSEALLRATNLWKE